MSNIRKYSGVFASAIVFVCLTGNAVASTSVGGSGNVSELPIARSLAARAIDDAPVPPAHSVDKAAPLLLAQAQPAPASAPAAAVQSFSGDVFIRNAIAVAQSLSANGGAQAYDTGSAVLKRVATKDDFVKSVAATNARVGRIVSRDWVRVERLNVASPAAGAPASPIPPGNYVTVVLLARGAQGGVHVEQVSFRFDEDSNWRLAGVNAPATAAPRS